MISNVQPEGAVQEADACDLPNTSEEGLQKDWRKIVKKKDKELEKYRREKDEQSRQFGEMQKTIKMLKNEKYEQQKLLQATNADNHNLKIETDRLKQELTVKQMLIDSLSQQTIQGQINELETEIGRLRDKNSKLLSQNASYKKEVAALELKHSDTNLLKHDEQDEQIERLTRVNLSLASELNALKAKMESSFNELQGLREMQNIVQLVSVLTFKLKYETLEEYDGLDGLISRVRFMRRVVQKKKRKELYKLAPQKQSQENVRYGYLVEKEGWFWFVCITSDEMYRVGSNPMALKSDMPASAVLKNDWANIVNMFEEDESIERGSGKCSSPNNNERAIGKKGLTHSLNGIKVLVIGSRSLIKYQQVLEQCGAEVETNNPYEQNIEMRRGAFNRAEIVIICASHVPHNLLSPSEISDARVEIIQRDNMQSILARVRFAMIRLKYGHR